MRSSETSVNSTRLVYVTSCGLDSEITENGDMVCCPDCTAERDDPINMHQRQRKRRKGAAISSGHRHKFYSLKERGGEKKKSGEKKKNCRNHFCKNEKELSDAKNLFKLCAYVTCGSHVTPETSTTIFMLIQIFPLFYK